MSRPLKNYIRTYRRTSSLSQDEVAYLLGYRQGGFQISRFERGRRVPTLEVALGLALLFDCDPLELFAGEAVEVAETLARRAKVLRHRVAREPAGLRRERRLIALDRLLHEDV